MNLVYFITGMGIGGAEQIVRDLSLRFANNDNNVTIIILSGNPVNLPIHKNIKIINLYFKKNIFYLPILLNKILKLLKKINPDIIHSHMFHANIIARLLKIFYNNTILICSAHSNNEGGKLRMFLYRLTNFLGDEFINVSKDAVLVFEKKNAVAVNKMKFIYNGIDLEKFRFSDKNIDYFNKYSPKFLIVGSLTELKDHKNLLNAFSLVKKNIPNAKLIIVGDGPLKNYLLKYTSKLNLTESVEFYGIRNDIPELMRESNILVLSSSHEGFGIVLAEALASGLLVVSTDCGGSKEVLGDSRFLAPVRDSFILAELMIKATELSKDERKDILFSGRKRVSDFFDIEKIYLQWNQLYNLKMMTK